MLWVYRWHLHIEQAFLNTTKNTTGHLATLAGPGAAPIHPSQLGSPPLLGMQKSVRRQKLCEREQERERDGDGDGYSRTA